MSTFVEKFLDFDISVQHELEEDSFIKSELEESVGKTVPKKDDTVEKGLEKLKHQLGTALTPSISNLIRYQRAIRTNEHRNYWTVKGNKI